TFVTNSISFPSVNVKLPEKLTAIGDSCQTDIGALRRLHQMKYIQIWTLQRPHILRRHNQWSKTLSIVKLFQAYDLQRAGSDSRTDWFCRRTFFAKTDIPASVSSRHARSLRRARFLHRREIWMRASSEMLTDLRSHFKASFVTASKREKREGMKGRSSDWALRESR
ncbi:hypothetical protein RJ641_032157, partial [Dillenia turbinata]